MIRVRIISSWCLYESLWDSSESDPIDLGITVGQLTYRSKAHIWEIFFRPKNYFSYTYTENNPIGDSRYVTENLVT